MNKIKDIIIEVINVLGLFALYTILIYTILNII